MTAPKRQGIFSLAQTEQIPEYGELLFGREEAALQPLSLLGCGTIACLPTKVSRQIRDINDNFLVSYHPEGMCAFMACT